MPKKDITVEFVAPQEAPAPTVVGVGVGLDGTTVSYSDGTESLPSYRRALLSRAADLVDGDRNAQYGDPIDDFRRTATYWSTHAGGVLRRRLADLASLGLDSRTVDILNSTVDHLFDPHDVAIMMTFLKNSRLAWSPTKQDHWDDGAGYYACGWDCVHREGTF